MRTIGTLPSLRVSRNPLVSFGFLVAVMYAAYQVAQAILANDLTGLGFVAVLGLGGAVFIAVLNDWRRGLYLLIAWILFEDFVRKYLGNNMVIYFGKVVLATVLYISRKSLGLDWRFIPKLSCPTDPQASSYNALRLILFNNWNMPFPILGGLMAMDSAHAPWGRSM
jgi:hypothetical protein